MFVESISIICVLLLTLVVFLRSKKYTYVPAIISLAIVPAGNIAGLVLAGKVPGIEPSVFMAAVNVCALILCCMTLGIVSHKFKSKKVRTAFLIFAGIFVGILSFIFIFEALTNEVPKISFL